MITSCKLNETTENKSTTKRLRKSRNLIKILNPSSYEDDDIKIKCLKYDTSDKSDNVLVDKNNNNKYSKLNETFNEDVTYPLTINYSSQSLKDMFFAAHFLRGELLYVLIYLTYFKHTHILLCYKLRFCYCLC